VIQLFRVLLEDSAQSTSQKNRIPCSHPDDVIYCQDSQLSKASSVRTTRNFCPNLHLRREASNCSSLHLSRCFSSTSVRHSVFDQLWDFFPKHRYGKIAATIRTMCILVRTHSSIRQVVHSKFKRPDDNLKWSRRASYLYGNCVHLINRPNDHSLGLDERSLYMKIACN
jgi:hypothetical protein